MHFKLDFFYRKWMQYGALCGTHDKVLLINTHAHALIHAVAEVQRGTIKLRTMNAVINIVAARKILLNFTQFFLMQTNGKKTLIRFQPVGWHRTSNERNENTKLTDVILVSFLLNSVTNCLYGALFVFIYFWYIGLFLITSSAYFFFSSLTCAVSNEKRWQQNIKRVAC